MLVEQAFSKLKKRRKGKEGTEQAQYLLSKLSENEGSSVPTAALAVD